MANFQYLARQLDGRTTSGALLAASEHEALAMLAGKNLFPVRVTQIKPTTGRVGSVSAGVVAPLYRQLADLLRAGVPLTRGLEILARQTRHPTLAEVLPRLLRTVKDGSTLADALQEHPTVFRELVVSIVRAGEEGGFLEDALQRVATLVERQEEIRSRIRGALAYPCFLLITGIVVVLGMLVFFVPNFTPIFERLAKNGELPWLTQALIALSDLLRGQSWLCALLMCAVLAVGTYALRMERVRQWLDRVRLKLPLLGDIQRDLAISRFCRVLGTMMHNGVPILRSLRIAREATGVRDIAAAITTATSHISAGRSLANPLAECRHFQPEVLEMIAVGEQSNRLDAVLIDVADTLERRTQRQLDLVVRLIEPALLLVIAILVLLMIVGLLLPTFDSAGTIS